MNKTKILNALQISQKLDRMAYQVYETNFAEKELLVVGIEGNGFKVAGEIAKRLKKISHLKIMLGKIKLDKNEPWKEDARYDFSDKDYVNKSVLVVDDVLNSGKTLMHAIKIFLNKPVKRLNTLVLVDRSHIRYPVKADFVGLSLNTTLQDHIEANFSTKGKETVYLN